MKKQLWLLLLCTLVLTLSACVMLPAPTDTPAESTTDTADTTTDTADTTVDDATMEEMGTIVDIAANNENFSTLVTALTEAGLVDLMGDPNAEWTVFAPTNDAFAALPESLLDRALTDKELLTRILTYHVMQGVVTSDMVSTMMAPTMEMDSVDGDLMGSQLDVKYYADGKITVNEANIVMADVMASNGVIHAIDAVLLPPDIDAMMYFFATGPAEEETAEEATTEEATAEEAAAEEAAAEEAAAEEETAEEATAEEAATEETATEETATDNDATGEMGTIVDAAVSNENFSTLVTAVTEAGLADLLAASNTEWTVFAPTNDAFAALPEGVLDTVLADKELLTRILTYHVMQGVVTSDMVSTMMAPSMEMGSIGGELMDSQLDIKYYANGNITINEANIVMADVMTSNGVIHAVDAVLLPPDVAAMVAGNDAVAEETVAEEAVAEETVAEEAVTEETMTEGAMGTIVDIAVSNENFSTLVTAVTEAGLVDLLAASNVKWTVFAPTNDAFAALPEGVLDTVLADKELLTRILTYHVMEGIVTFDMISTMMAPSMEMSSIGGDLMGSQLDIKYYENGSITINEANIVIADVTASNGVIHAVDAVLLPPDVAAMIK